MSGIENSVDVLLNRLEKKDVQLMYLEELTASIKLENLEVECRARLDRQNPQGWIKTVGGFLNTPGVIFYIGVEDKTFK